MLLTVEAVVRGNTSRIKGVLLCVTCERTTKGVVNKEDNNGTVLCKREVSLVAGYLKQELSINVQSFADVYTVTAKAVDCNDGLWNVGSTLSFRVKCDDSLLSKSQMAKAYV